MQPNQALALSFLLALMPAGVPTVSAAPPRQRVEVPLSPEGRRLEEKYADQLKVLRADIPASNGVIHVIDTVVLPD